jgi:hypothetical protein
MNVLDFLFGSTESLKARTRGQILLWLLPTRILEILVGPILSLYILIEAYVTQVPEQYKMGAVGLIFSAILVFGMYSRFMKWLKEWETNKRMKWFLVGSVKVLPMALSVIVLNIAAIDFMVFASTIDKVIYAYLGSYALSYFADPLATELRVRDRIRLNSDQGRVID